ncbi:hypothetical protein [Sulfurimonas sp.]|uniref:hypothetical protein n=1 Tax=Sulfurimonas sp. TaxID=2022749 RepID=UPI0025DFC5C5|nr:hypothetical protein [Sulfurimonas sp.]MCK9453674.1 hypothetical protein [Sulfurimonas sp.]
MKPLLKKDIEGFLKRFNSFIDSEFRSIEIISPTALKITLATQDSARGFDWITVNMEFSNISDAQLPKSSKLQHLDMDEGITLISEDNQFGFGVGSYSSFSNITDSVCYIKADSIKYLEGQF